MENPAVIWRSCQAGILLESRKLSCVYMFGSVCVTCDQGALKGVGKASCEFSFSSSQVCGRLM